MAEDKKIHEQPVPTVAKPDTDAKLKGAPVEPEAELEQPDEDGDHSTGGLIRQAWSLREASGMHEVDTKGRDAPEPERSLGASVARGEVGPMRPVRASTGERMARRRARRQEASQARREATPRPESSRSPEDLGPTEGNAPGKRR